MLSAGPDADSWDGANKILSVLWNEQLWGKYKILKVEETYEQPCCRWANYTERLSPFQRNRTGASWRNPISPDDPLTGNAPACVWCEFDGAFNDENPVPGAVTRTVQPQCAEQPASVCAPWP